MACYWAVRVFCGLFLTLQICVTVTASCLSLSDNERVELNFSGVLGNTDLDSIRDHILRTCDTLMHYQYLSVDLSGNDLTTLPVSLFVNTSCAESILSLNLSRNEISSLEGVKYESVTCLLELDVSFNTISRLTSESLPVSLELFDISHNGLKEIEAGAFANMNSLARLNASHNLLTAVETSVFYGGENKIGTVKRVDFSFNRISAFEPWPYGFSQDAYVDLSHNDISHFTNSANLTLSGGREMLGAKVNLSHNKLNRLIAEEICAYFNGRRPNAMELGNLALVLSDNPWICDCQFYWLVDVLMHSLVQMYSEVYNYTTCHTPARLHGTQLGYLLKNPDLLTCDVTEGCPAGCTCQDQPHNGFIRVDCDPANNLYTQLPSVLPPKKPLYLNLSGHELHTLESAGHSAPERSGSREVKSVGADHVTSYISRLYGLDVSRNKLTYIAPSFLNVATNLTLLNVSDNQLTTLPENIRSLSLADIYILGNRLVCTCDFIWFGDWVSATYTADNSPIDTPTTPPLANMPNPRTSDQDLQAAIEYMRDQQANKEQTVSPSGTTTPDPQHLTSLRCKTENGEEMLVTDMSVSALGCRRLAITLLVASGCLLLIIVGVLIVTWRWRYQVTVLLHYCVGDLGRRTRCCRWRHKGRLPNADDVAGGTNNVTNGAAGGYNMYAAHRYDVYVSMDESDVAAVDWLKNVLLPFLEGRQLRVYLPLRQELPGSCKAQARVEAMMRSHSVLILISHNYAQNGWCRYEFDHACCYLEQDQAAGNMVLLVIDNDMDNENNHRGGDDDALRGEHDQADMATALSQFRELDGHLETVEPLRTFLADRRYLALRDGLMKQKLLYELTSRRRKKKKREEVHV